MSRFATLALVLFALLAPSMALAIPPSKMVEWTEKGVRTEALQAAAERYAWDIELDDLVALKEAGVPTSIVETMWDHRASGGIAPAAPDARRAPTLTVQAYRAQRDAQLAQTRSNRTHPEIAGLAAVVLITGTIVAVAANPPTISTRGMYPVGG